MANRSKESRLSGSSASNPIPGMSGDIINPGIRPEELEGYTGVGSAQNRNSYVPDERPPVRETRGSGSDKNSDSRRLNDPDNLMDKIEEDTFPASDPPSFSPLTGVADRPEERTVSTRADDLGGGLPEDFKDNPQAQFEYGRKSQKATHHFDRTSRRLENGNPDVGDVDLGTIEADKPAQPDDNDHYDSADDDRER